MFPDKTKTIYYDKGSSIVANTYFTSEERKCGFEIYVVNLTGPEEVLCEANGNLHRSIPTSDLLFALDMHTIRSFFLTQCLRLLATQNTSSLHSVLLA